MISMPRVSERDVFIKARMLSEGVRVADSDLANLAAPGTLFGIRPFRFESGTQVAIVSNDTSRLGIAVDEEHATVLDVDEPLGTGTFLERPAWLNEPLSNGQPVSSVLPNVSARVINIQLHNVCYNWGWGRVCSYCNLFAQASGEVSAEARVALARLRAEAVRIATDHGTTFRPLGPTRIPSADHQASPETRFGRCSGKRRRVSGESPRYPKGLGHRRPPIEAASPHALRLGAGEPNPAPGRTRLPEH